MEVHLLMWKPVIYRDVDPTRYEVSDEGKIRLVNGKILNGCNPDNEKGYIRVTLVNKDGKLKKYALHRIVLAVFTYDSDLEVDHLDGVKNNPALSNLEYVTGDENKRRAAENGLYQSCDDHFKAVLTNDQVHSICRLFEKGYNVKKVIRKLDLPDTQHMVVILTSILHHKSWKRISKQYNWAIDDVRLKVYKHKHLKTVAKLILSGNYTCREIAKMFPQYDEIKLRNVAKKMKQGKLYKSIMKEVESSTTIDEDIRDGEGFTILLRRSH